MTSRPTQRGWSIVPVSSLPYPDDLFKCPRRNEFLALTGGSEAQTTLAAAFESFAADGKKAAACEYHRPDWIKAAAVACALVERGRAGDMHELAQACRIAELNACTEWAAYSYFAEPMFISVDKLGNGQHRTCAMRIEGVERCPIED